jgi:hypothetical protein
VLPRDANNIKYIDSSHSYDVEEDNIWKQDGWENSISYVE